MAVLFVGHVLFSFLLHAFGRGGYLMALTWKDFASSLGLTLELFDGHFISYNFVDFVVIVA